MRHTKPEFPAEFWIVADLSELQHGRVCTTREDVCDAIDLAERNCEQWRVFRVGTGELGRDVTAEFIRDDEPAEDDRAYADRRFSDARERLERMV